MQTILAIDGDGISTEILDATLRVIDALDLDLRIQKETVGFRSLEEHGVTITNQVVQSASTADGIILGPVSHLDYPSKDAGGLNPSGVLRKALDLYANIRPAKSWQGLEHPIDADIDLIIVRENTEGFYADRTMFAGSGEVMPTEDLAIAFRKVTKKGSERIARAAFRIAKHKAKKVTAIHKANVLRLSDGLFLDEVRKVREGYPALDYNEMLVDAAAAHLVRNPGQFGVMVTTNMFGDILSDLASELSGGLGLAGSINQGDHHAMAQAQHGSAPDIAGLGKANPVSLILSTGMLLDWMASHYEKPEYAAAANRIKEALKTCLFKPETRTYDLGGHLGTDDFTQALIQHL